MSVRQAQPPKRVHVLLSRDERAVLAAQRCAAYCNHCSHRKEAITPQDTLEDVFQLFISAHTLLMYDSCILLCPPHCLWSPPTNHLLTAGNISQFVGRALGGPSDLLLFYSGQHPGRTHTALDVRPTTTTPLCYW